MRVRPTSARVAVATALLGCAAGAPPAPPAGGWDAWPWAATAFPPGAVLAARLVPFDPARRAAGHPARWEARLTLTQPGPETARVALDCNAFGLRLYANRDSTLLGAPMWDDRPTGRTLCRLKGDVMVVPAAESTAVAGLLVYPDSLAHRLPRGRYNVAVTLRPTAGGPVRAVRAGAIDVPGR